MRRFIRLFAGTAAALLLTTAAASAQTVELGTQMGGANETPAPGVLTGSAGTAQVFVNMATQAVTYRVEVFNLPSGAVGGHFHVGGPGLAGPIVVDLAPPANISNDFVLTGTVNASALRPRAEQGIRTWEDFIQALVGGQVYVNIHSAVFPGGEIRGQLQVISGQ
jgi:hypothetical protein